MVDAVHGVPVGVRLPGVIYPEDTLPPIRNFLMGAQHVVAMFGATVLGPLLMGFNPNTCILFSGIATLIFYIFVRGKIPSYLGSSFSFIAAVIAATGYSGTGPNPNIAIALGGIVAAGALYFLIGAIVQVVGHRWLEWLMPPVVTGAIVAIIGLNLAHVAVGDVTGAGYEPEFGLGTIVLIVLAAVWSPGFLARIPILVGGGIAYAGYYYLCNLHGLGKPIEFSGVANAAWFGLPPFHMVAIDRTAILLIAPVALVLVAENLGHVRAISAMTGAGNSLDRYLGRAFMADGLATMISGAGGGTGVTTYAENMGVMSITKNFSSQTLVIAALIAILLGLSPKFGALILTIPLPVIGGLSFVLFGLITATAGRIWVDNKVDFTQTTNLLVVGVSVVMGAGDLTWKIGGVAFGGIATATFSALLLYHVIARSHRSITSLARG